MPSRRDPPSKGQGPRSIPPRGFKDVDDEYEITSHGGHRIHRDGTRYRKNEEGTWVYDSEPQEVDPHPSGPRDAGKGAGEFIGGLVDGIRENVKPSTLLLLASFLGLAGGYGGQKVSEATSAPAPTDAQIDVLLRAIQRQNLDLADLSRRVQMLEISRDIGKTLPEVKEAATAASSGAAEITAEVGQVNKALEEQLKGAGAQ